MVSGCIGIIPARYRSTRLPGKPLARIAGRSMLEHVWRRALQVRGLDALIIATDDARIAEEARGFGAEVVMTPEDLPTGSDRVAWVMRSRSESHVVNIQGDEPLLDPRSVELVLAALSSPGVSVATAAAPVLESSATGVAVTVDENSDALSFARGQKAPLLQHIGLYAYRLEALERFAGRPRSGGEIHKELEQLRFLEYGDQIRVVLVPESSPSVDTPEDLERVRQLFSTGDPA
jgi:3-deoxy-manno-octulosonate cytidylyltransferase (CMP-KDO synthetase)